MSILKKLEEEIKTAMKARDQARLDTVRLIKTTVKNKEIELIRPLTEQEFFAALSTMVKQRKESIEQFSKGGREDLAVKEKKEIEIIESFLPKPLSEAELDSLIQNAVQKTGAKGPKDMGAVMKELKGVVTGRVDGKLFADKVKNKLASLPQ